MVDVVRLEVPVTPKTVDEAVALLVGRLSDKDKTLVRSLPEEELTERLHFTLGMAIRNDLGLWGENTDLLKSCGSEHPPRHTLAKDRFTGTDSERYCALALAVRGRLIARRNAYRNQGKNGGA
jgi:hypothetical protein